MNSSWQPGRTAAVVLRQGAWVLIIVSLASFPVHWKNSVGSVSSQTQSQLNGRDLQRLIGACPFWFPCVGQLIYESVPHKYLQNKDWLFSLAEIAQKIFSDNGGKKRVQIVLNLFRFCKYKHLCAYFNTIAMIVRGPQFFGKIDPYYCSGLGNRWAHNLIPFSFLLPSSCVSFSLSPFIHIFPPLK